jgi:hypothetical protein
LRRAYESRPTLSTVGRLQRRNEISERAGLHELAHGGKVGANARSSAQNETVRGSVPCARSSGTDDCSGRRKSIPCAAASNSIATMPAVLRAMGSRRRAALVDMLT